MTFLCTPMHREKALKTPLGGLQFGEPAAFLFQQVILHTAGAFGCFENIFQSALPSPNKPCNPSRVPVTNP